MSYDVECPYCKHGVEISHDDNFGMEEDRLHEYQCPYCDKYFIFETRTIIDHTAYPADCLNGAPHKYKRTITVPTIWTRLVCEDCGHEKPLMYCPNCGNGLEPESSKNNTMYCRKCKKIISLAETVDDTGMAVFPEVKHGDS